MSNAALLEATTAAVLYVDSDATGGDGLSWSTAFSTIKDALDVSSSTDPTVIKVKQGTYFIDSTIFISKAVTLEGGYQGIAEDEVPNPDSYPSIVDAGLQDNCLVVQVSDVTIDGFSIQNCIYPDTYAGAGIQVHTGVTNLTIANSTFSNNSALWGGAIAFLSNSAGSIENCNFINNTTINNDTGDEYPGGAIYAIAGSTLAIRNSSFKNNESDWGGAILSFGGVDISGSIFEGNTATVCGGAVYLEGSSNNSIVDNSFLSNNAAYGGAIRTYSNSSDVIELNKFLDNEASECGGAVQITNGFDYLINDNTFTANSALYGGAAHIETGNNSIINNSLFEQNIAAELGGSVHFYENNGGQIQNSTFYKNSACKRWRC